MYSSPCYKFLFIYFCTVSITYIHTYIYIFGYIQINVYIYTEKIMDIYTLFNSGYPWKLSCIE